MLLFGHIGITLGAAALLINTLPCKGFPKASENEGVESSHHCSEPAATLHGFTSHKILRFAYPGSYFDIGLLSIGSLLPDIIDKPLGLLFFRETFSNGRIFCHTLLFLVLLVMSGLYLYRCHSKTWMLVFSFGTFMHLILDQMWQSPQTLFWPGYGFHFEKTGIANWMPNILHALLTAPEVYVPELAGLVIVIWFMGILLYKRKAYPFVKHGSDSNSYHQ